MGIGIIWHIAPPKKELYSSTTISYERVPNIAERIRTNNSESITKDCCNFSKKKFFPLAGNGWLLSRSGAKAATSPELKSAFTEHLAETKEQLVRLNQLVKS